MSFVEATKLEQVRELRTDERSLFFHSRRAASSGDSEGFMVPPGKDHRDRVRATKSTLPSRLHMMVALAFIRFPYKTSGRLLGSVCRLPCPSRPAHCRFQLCCSRSPGSRSALYHLDTAHLRAFRWTESAGNGRVGTGEHACCSITQPGPGRCELLFVTAQVESEGACSLGGNRQITSRRF
jgi:hypothetical protein